MKHIKFIRLILLSVFCPFSFLFASDIASLPEFTPDDRIMVLAPHPDDETIGAAGIIQKAAKAGLPLKIVYYTNGDNNELAFIVYEKRIVFRKRAFLYMGEMRRKETVAAMKSLGADESQLVFLGYPDFGTMSIFYQILVRYSAL